MATLGAELGCGRHLASTVVTGSGQRSSTFLAELCLSTVLVLALRAFHCRPRRKKRARCTARVMSSIVDAPRSRRKRPDGRGAAEQRDELAPSWVEHAASSPGATAIIRPPPAVLAQFAGPPACRWSVSIVFGAELNCSESRCWPAPQCASDQTRIAHHERFDGHVCNIRASEVATITSAPPFVQERVDW
jgi:hypothetical protein